MVRAGLRNPVLVSVKEKEGQTQATPSSLENQYVICQEPRRKFALLVEFLRVHKAEKVLVFFSTCASVEYFSECLNRLVKDVKVFSIHGKKDKRHKVFDAFRKADAGILICTDVMARGVDIPSVKWVIQFDPPTNAEAFVHRCGRTARNSAEGTALLFLLPTEETYVNFIGLNQKVELTPMSEAATPNVTEKQTASILAQMRDWQRNDRSMFDLANRAFVSMVQAYSKHECKYILRLKGKKSFSKQQFGFKLLTGYQIFRLVKWRWLLVC